MILFYLFPKLLLQSNRCRIKMDTLARNGIRASALEQKVKRILRFFLFIFLFFIFEMDTTFFHVVAKDNHRKHTSIKVEKFY
jgi:hypothetical protein